MNALFAHDHWYVRTNAGFHDPGGLPEEVLMRYVRAFGCLRVICRERTHDRSNLALIANPAISFLPLPNLRSLKNLGQLLSVYTAIKSAVGEADLVIARLPSLFGYLVAREARRVGKPYLIEVVGDALAASLNHSSNVGRITGPIEEFLTKAEVAKSQRTIYVTESALQAKYPSHGNVYSCTNAQVTPVSEEYVLQKYGQALTRGGVTIGLVGALDVGYKGQDTALRCLQSLKFDYGHRDLCLRFLGRGDPGPLRALAEQLGVGDMVAFDGTLPPGEAVLGWMDRIDVLVQASLLEGLSRSVIEAMSRGCSVVATKVGGTDELLDAEWLVEPSDDRLMAAALDALLTDPHLRMTTGLRNLRTSHRYRKDVVDARRKAAFADLAAAAKVARQSR